MLCRTTYTHLGLQIIVIPLYVSQTAIFPNLIIFSYEIL